MRSHEPCSSTSSVNCATAGLKTRPTAPQASTCSSPPSPCGIPATSNRPSPAWPCLPRLPATSHRSGGSISRSPAFIDGTPAVALPTASSGRCEHPDRCSLHDAASCSPIVHAWRTLVILSCRNPRSGERVSEQRTLPLAADPVHAHSDLGWRAASHQPNAPRAADGRGPGRDQLALAPICPPPSADSKQQRPPAGRGSQPQRDPLGRERMHRSVAQLRRDRLSGPSPRQARTRFLNQRLSRPGEDRVNRMLSATLFVRL